MPRTDCDPHNWLIFRWRPGEVLCGKIVGFNEEHVIVDLSSPDGGPEFWGQTQVKPAHVLAFGSEKLVRAALREIRTDLGKDVCDDDKLVRRALEKDQEARENGKLRDHLEAFVDRQAAREGAAAGFLSMKEAGEAVVDKLRQVDAKLKEPRPLVCETHGRAMCEACKFDHMYVGGQRK